MHNQLDELETHTKIKNIRVLYTGINDFQKSYQPGNKIVKDEKGDLDSHSILARWRNHFSQLLNVQGTRKLRQTKIHTAEPLVFEPSTSEVEMAIEKVKGHKSPSIDQIAAEFIKSGGRTICYESINVLMRFGISGIALRVKELIIVPVYKKAHKTDCSDYRGT
jgi:hypothetical protein